MSSGKKRKADIAEATPGVSSPISAVSAFAARRALAAVQSPETSDQEDSQGHTITPLNAFDALRKLRGGRGSIPGEALPISAAKSNGTKDISRRIATIADQSPLTSIIHPSGIAKPIQYASFRLTKSNHRRKQDGTRELRLSNERFLVVGDYRLRVRTGSITIAGATLYPSDSFHQVYAPLCHAVPVIRTGEDTRLELHPSLRARNLRQLARLSPLFDRIWNEPGSDDDSQVTYRILYTVEDAPSRGCIQELVSAPEWNQKLASIDDMASKTPNISCLVCGPKSSGKSTFSRLVINRLLTGSKCHTTLSNGVALLDLDPGQPEYSPPGTLSLVRVGKPNLGPSFSHPGGSLPETTIVRSHTLASVTMASSPDLFLSCAIDLLRTYRNELPGFPLVINTPGWILGTGLEILLQLVRIFDPLEVLYMSEDGPIDVVDALRNVVRGSLSLLPSQPAEFTVRTAAHLRAMQQMAYCHLDMRGKEIVGNANSWTSRPLSSIRPLQIHFAGPERGFLGIVSYEYDSPPELLTEAINGMLLAAVEIEHADAFSAWNLPKSTTQVLAEAEPNKLGGSSLDPPISQTPEGIPFIRNPDDVALDPQHSRLIGLLLVRGIDTTSKTLQILTPVPYERLMAVQNQARRIVLVHGKFGTPTWAYTEELYWQSTAQSRTKDEAELVEGDTTDDSSEMGGDTLQKTSDLSSVPWVENVKGDQKRQVGSKVWRVRRDMGRNND